MSIKILFACRDAAGHAAHRFEILDIEDPDGGNCRLTGPATEVRFLPDGARKTRAKVGGREYELRAYRPMTGNRYWDSAILPVRAPVPVVRRQEPRRAPGVGAFGDVPNYVEPFAGARGAPRPPDGAAHRDGERPRLLPRELLARGEGRSRRASRSTRTGR
jgi:hypothetical protein